MENKKGSEFSFQQIIALALVIVLVVLVIIFIFKVQIINYVKILPGYQLPEGDSGVNQDVSPDVIGNTDQFSCIIEVGKVEFDEKTNKFFIHIGTPGNYQKTNLIWKGSETEAKIIYDGKWSWRNPLSNGNKQVAEVERGYISAYDFKEGQIDKAIIEQLGKIDGARKIKVENKLCKDSNE